MNTTEENCPTKHGKVIAFLLVAAIACVCVAGTKISRLTKTSTFDTNAIFLVVTGTTQKETRGVEALYVARTLQNYMTGIPSVITNEVLTNISSTGISTGATNSGAYVGSSSGRGTNNNLTSVTNSTSTFVGTIGTTSSLPRGVYSTDFQQLRQYPTQFNAGDYSFLGGGSHNQIDTNDQYGVIVGGQNNRIGDWIPGAGWDFIGAGVGNVILTTEYSSILGGAGNHIIGATASSIGGGFHNTNGSTWSYIGGGVDNENAGVAGFIGGGDRNKVYGDYSAILYGTENVIGIGPTPDFAIHNFIVGGDSNLVTGSMNAAIGYQLTNTLDASMLLGYRFGWLRLTPSGATNATNFTVQGNLVAEKGARLSNLTASRGLALNASKDVTNTTATATEIDYLSGVTSAVQTQINARQGGTDNGTNWSTLATNKVVMTNDAWLLIRGSNGVQVASGTAITVTPSSSGSQMIFTVGVSDAELIEWSGISTNLVAFTNSPHITSRQGGSSVLTNLAGTVANNVTNENSTMLQINSGTLTVSPGAVSNLNSSTIDFQPNNVITNYGGLKGVIWTNYVQTASNFVFSFNTNYVELKNQTNVVFTNIVEEATGIRGNIEAHVHNTTGVTMGLVWPAYGAQHGYYFGTNANNPIITTTTLASGSHAIVSFSCFGTNIFATITTWP